MRTTFDSEATGLAIQPEKPPLSPADKRKRFLTGFFFWAFSLFLLGMGMKLLMLHRCLNPLPYFDQWEAEAAAIYVPYYEHALRFLDLFHAQNEHRIFFTHIYDLALLLLNRQWDSQLQMVGNAVIHCATVAGFAWLLAILMGRRYWPFIWLPSAVAVMSPFGWENALWGFQSQYYFLLLFSLLTLWLLRHEPRSSSWWWGVVAGVCALFTMASGLLASVAVAAMSLLEILKNPPQWRRWLPTLGVCAALAIAGFLLVDRTFDARPYAAHSLKEFFAALGNNLTWPTGLRPWLAPLNLFPLLVLGWVYFRSPQGDQPVEWIVLGLGAWIILQSLATAIARGVGGPAPAWRYMDTLCFLFTANVLSVALLVGKYRAQLRFPPVWYAAFLTWLIPCVVSLCMLDERARNIVIPVWARFQQHRVELMREFLVKNNDKVFTFRDQREVPWNYVPELVFLLRTKDIPPILPACARNPLKVMPKENAPSAFVPNGVRLDKPDPPTEFCLGSYHTNGTPAHGIFESAPLVSSLPYLEIQVAGNLGAPGLSLELVDLASGKAIAVKPAREPGGQWATVDIKAPAGQFKLVARADSSTGWFAFKEPRELGRLSFWAQEVVGTGKYFIAAGFLSLVTALATCFLLPADKNSNLSSKAS